MPVWEDVYVALMHHPVYNRKGEVVTTTITNLDLHDIARTVCTYDLKRYYVLNPVKSQQAMVRRMCEYWTAGLGAEHNVTRKQAFGRLRVCATLAEACSDIRQQTGAEPTVVMTDARVFPNSIGYSTLRHRIRNDGEVYLLVFGTGWGIARETMYKADYILEPVCGCSEYNHLSVRSAAAIILDRLLSEAWWK